MFFSYRCVYILAAFGYREMLLENSCFFHPLLTVHTLYCHSYYTPTRSENIMKKRYTFTLSPETKKAAEELAKSEGLGLSTLIEIILRKELKKEDKS